MQRVTRVQRVVPIRIPPGRRDRRPESLRVESAMRLIDYLDKGAALGPDSPCLTMGERDMSYVEVRRVTWRVARALERAGVKPGDKVAILSSNDPIAFACVFSHRTA